MSDTEENRHEYSLKFGKLADIDFINAFVKDMTELKGMKLTYREYLTNKEDKLEIHNPVLPFENKEGT